MNAYQINKFAGSFLASLLFIMAINVVGDLVVPLAPEPAGGGHATPAAAGPATASAPATAAADEPSLAALLAAASVERGAKVSRKCAACHTFGAGGRNRVGPNLWDVVGAAVASRGGFAYSDALTGLGGDWSYERLDAFLAKPKEFLPGVKMSFAGIRKPGDRAALIAFMRGQSGQPLALPVPEAEGEDVPEPEGEAEGEDQAGGVTGGGPR